VNDRAILSRFLSIFALAAALAVTGCYDPDAGTIPADRATRAELVRANSDGPPKPSKSRRKPQDFGDVSPASRGGKGKS
jgi:hypothetical protein